MIPSLTGDGIAIALHSGQQAAEAWLGALDAATYQRTLARGLAPQMRLASLLHRAGMGRLTQTAAIPFVRLFPSLLRHAASRTRVRTAPESTPHPTPTIRITQSAPWSDAKCLRQNNAAVILSILCL